MSQQLAVNTPTQASPFFVIKITQGANKGDTYRITPPGVVIGSDSEACQIAINDPRVSRQQCRIDFQPETITIEDLSGKSSTLVNQKPISAAYALAHGDVISIGDSLLIFHTSTGPRVVIPGGSPVPSTPGTFPSFGSPKGPASFASEPKSKNFYIIIGIIVLVIGGFFMIPSKPKPAPPRVVSPEVTSDAITAVQKRQEELQKPYANLSDKDIYNKRSAQKTYIHGFRDYQNGRYNRAIEAFQTTLATDPGHPMARRYFRLAEKRRQDMVDYHMDLGNKYKNKSMYKYCMAEFEKVLQIINQPNQKKYQLAKEQIKECRLSLQGSN